MTKGALGTTRLFVSLVLVSLGFSLVASATPPLLRNSELDKQVAQNPTAYLPCKPELCFAVQGRYFYRTNPYVSRSKIIDLGSGSSMIVPGEFVYYHGGYWLDTFAQIQPHEEFALNVQLALEQGASSYGTTAETRVLPFVAFKWERTWNEGLSTQVQGFDLGAQTLGSGLILEEKRMSGMRNEIRSGDLRFVHMLEGTSSFQIDGDLWYLQADWKQERLGLYTLSTASIANSSLGRSLSFNTVGLFSRWPLSSSTRLSWEVARYGDSRPIGPAWGALIKTRSEFLGDEQEFLMEPQLRYYSKAFGSRFAEAKYSLEYVPPEAENKSFLTPENTFRDFGQANDWIAAALRLQMKRFLNSSVYALGMWEGVVMSVDRDTQTRSFLTLGFGYHPRTRGGESLEIFVSNKALLGLDPGASNFTYSQSGESGRRLFADHWHVGGNAFFSY
jgi:hypothetical protein